MSKLVRNLPCEQGKLLGRELARLADRAETESLKKFPGTMVRCKTCAFRAGTAPNGTLLTVMDALKCAMEQVPFLCHEDLPHPCMGWIEMANVVQRNPISTPWEFSE
jgi:hypothetical protein